ncbi:MAG: CPBP family intramembrane glutamic endopeptidase [Sarcina sp.]
MSENLNRVKKEIGISLGINFAIIAVIGLLFFNLPKGDNGTMLVSAAATVFMIIPCFSVMITMKYFSKEDFNKYEASFVRWIIIGSIIIILGLIVILIGKQSDFALLLSLLQYPISLVLIIKALKNGKHLERFNLRFNKNLKWVLIGAVIFISIKLGLLLIGTFILKESISINPTMLGLMPISLIENFFLGFFMFLGEEFGWRYYLQPRLQVLFGKKIGVIILGAIWGIWHLPLCFTLYSPETPINCIISHVAFCITLGIFLGFVYMKTENIFAPIIIHLINNVLAVVLNNGSYTTVITKKDLILSMIINIIIFVPFLFTKEYKKEDQKELIVK